MAAKSYWMKMSLATDRDKSACKSWFGFVADDLTPYKAECLCDIQTDREKKLRAFMVSEDGKNYRLERTMGGKSFTTSRMRIDTPAPPALARLAIQTLKGVGG